VKLAKPRRLVGRRVEVCRAWRPAERVEVLISAVVVRWKVCVERQELSGAVRL
jgi:hypothetical protein